MIKENVRNLKDEHNIIDGKIKYSDLNIPAKPFFSNKYKIAGKPDYIVERKNHYIPVEVKTGNYSKPQKNHIFQLASYCQLLEENYGQFVPYGILVYNGTNQFKIPYSPDIRFEFESTIKKMRQTLKTGKISINHNEAGRCINCSMRSYCNSNLL